MLNEIVVPIYNVFKIGRGFYARSKTMQRYDLEQIGSIVVNDAYITNQLISFSYFNNLL